MAEGDWWPLHATSSVLMLKSHLFTTNHIKDKLSSCSRPQGKVLVHPSVGWPPQTDKRLVYLPGHDIPHLLWCNITGLTRHASIGSGDEWKRTGRAVSNAEKDRQQILEEMKKRTQLLTDNSWIRQRSSSFYKPPIYVGVPMKRWVFWDSTAPFLRGSSCFKTFGYDFSSLSFPNWLPGTSPWTTWKLCVSPTSRLLRSVALVQTLLLPRVGTPLPATALDQ